MEKPFVYLTDTEGVSIALNMDHVARVSNISADSITLHFSDGHELTIEGLPARQIHAMIAECSVLPDGRATTEVYRLATIKP